MAYQQPHHHAPWQAQHGHHPANGKADLSKSYIPSIMVIALVGFAVTATYTGTRWLADQEIKERTTVQRLDGVEQKLGEQSKKLESIDGTLKRLVNQGPWVTEWRKTGP